MTSLKTKVDNLHIDKRKAVPPDLSKLCNSVDNDDIKKGFYDQLATKFNAIDTKIWNASGLITKIQYDLYKEHFDRKIKDVEKKMPKAS